MMQRIVLACAALAFGTFGSPLAAQQTQPDQSTQQSPTPSPQAAPEQPPPFPPMPKAKPTHRHVDVGEPRAGRTHHRATQAEHKRIREHHAPPPSRKTIRKCHAMSYKQIMRSDTCRALMKQELGAAERHGKHQHKASRKHHRHRKG